MCACEAPDPKNDAETKFTVVTYDVNLTGARFDRDIVVDSEKNVLARLTFDVDTLTIVDFNNPHAVK